VSALRVQAVAGEISAHLFENSSVGLTRNLFWSVTLDCKPVLWGEEEWECSFSTEWLTWPVRDWRHLHGQCISSAKNPELVESSFYLAQHHPLKLASLSLSRIDGTPRFNVAVDAMLDLEGFDELDGEDVPIVLRCEAEFTGLVVVPDNLEPAPKTSQEASAVLERFIDLGCFSAPHWDDFRFVFAPR